MSSKNIVWPYDQQTADWLTELGYPHPLVKHGNRIPTTGEMKRAIESVVGSPIAYPDDFDYLDVQEPETDTWLTFDHFNWAEDASSPGCSVSAPGGGFTVRYMCEFLARILVNVCQHCGQMTLMSDSGGPVIIFAEASDPVDFAARYATQVALRDMTELTIFDGESV